MNDAAVVEDIETDLVEPVDADEPEIDEDIIDEDEAPAEEEAEPSDSSPEKKDDSFQTRIDELTGKYRTEERARIVAETRYKQMQEQMQERMQAKPVEPGKTLADFEYDEPKYAEYLTQAARQSAQEEVQQRIQQEKTTARQLEFEARESDFGAKVDDYNAVTRNPDLQITEYMIEALRTAEQGPDVLYYLGKNPDVARNLAGLHPLDMARELGRIEATKLVKPEKSTSKAPAPVPKLKAGSAATRVASNSPESDSLSDAEWLRRERKRLAARTK